MRTEDTQISWEKKKKNFVTPASFNETTISFSPAAELRAQTMSLKSFGPALRLLVPCLVPRQKRRERAGALPPPGRRCRRFDAEQRQALCLLLNSICPSSGYITLCQVVWTVVVVVFFFLSKEYLTSYKKKNGPLNYLWHVLCAVEEQSSLSQCAAPEFGSSGDSQERIYGPRGEICWGPAEQDKIFEG